MNWAEGLVGLGAEAGWMRVTRVYVGKGAQEIMESQGWN